MPALLWALDFALGALLCWQRFPPHQGGSAWEPLERPQAGWGSGVGQNLTALSVPGSSPGYVRQLDTKPLQEAPILELAGDPEGALPGREPVKKEPRGGCQGCWCAEAVRFGTPQGVGVGRCGSRGGCVCGAGAQPSV